MKVVVGVDGSEASFTALCVALQEAQALGADLEVVQAWPSVRWDDNPFQANVAAQEQVREEAFRSVSRLVARLRGGAHSFPVPVTVLTREGAPAHVLIDSSEGAVRVVVGASGRGALLQRVLGSVASEVARKASCPVIVVPADHVVTERPRVVDLRRAQDLCASPW
jgi:nucleotide-binding universal stress UspA family protein